VNLCRACGLDFGSVSGFDAHQVGRHEYTFAEGMRMDPPREDGRRCLDTEELEAYGWHRDRQGRWRQPRADRHKPHPRSTDSRRASETPLPDQEPILGVKAAAS
jgi:hypothetical protein